MGMDLGKMLASTSGVVFSPQKNPTWMVVSKILICTPTLGNDPICLIFFKGVETTN